MSAMLRRCLITLLIFTLPAIACSLGGAPGASSTSDSSTSVAAGGSPKVTIDSPADGAQGVVQQPFLIKVHATDSVGVTSVQLIESGRLVVAQPLPDANPDVSVLLSYRPTATGHISLQVIAYRQTVPSDPASLTIDIVGSTAELSNPNSLDPTSGVAAGVICVTKVMVANLNMRRGPGTTFGPITQLPLAEDLTVIGRNSDSSWFQVKRKTTAIGWVSASYTAPNDGCDKAPVVTPAP